MPEVSGFWHAHAQWLATSIMWFIGVFSFPSCWVFSAIFFVFLWRFLLCEQFFSVFVNFSKLFASVSSKVCLQTCLAIPSTTSRLHWICTVSLRPPVVNPLPQLRRFPHYCPNLLLHYRHPLWSASRQRLCHRPFPKPFSSHSIKICFNVGRFLGEWSDKFLQKYVWQFQCGFFRDKCAVDSYIDLNWFLLVFFSR